MYTKLITRTVVMTAVLAFGTAAVGQSMGQSSVDAGQALSSNGGHSMGQSSLDPGQALSSNNGPTLQQVPTNPGQPSASAETAGIQAARWEACDEAGGRYVVGVVCFDREGNAINM